MSRATNASTGNGQRDDGQHEIRRASRHPARDRQPAEPDAEHEREHRRDDEYRDRDARDRKRHDDAVGRTAPRSRRPDARRNAERQRQQHRRKADREAHGQAARDELADREVPELERRTEIAMEQSANVAAELHVNRLVEPVGRLEVGADLRCQRLFLVERPARRQPRQQE